MLRPVIASFLHALLTATVPTQAAGAHVHSHAGSTRGQEAYQTDSMTALFGAGWDNLVFETVHPAQLFADGRVFVYLEGSDTMADELEAFLVANVTRAEKWVAKGGRLYVNSAPREGDGMGFPFGVDLVYTEESWSDDAVAVDPDEPAFAGPLPVETRVFTGEWSSHAFVSGKKLDPILRDRAFRCALAMTRRGKGAALFGGLTTPNFWFPQPAAADLRHDALAHAAGRQLDPGQVRRNMKLGYPAEGESPKDSLKLTIRNPALGDLTLGGLAIGVEVDGFVMQGVLDASGHSPTSVDDAVTRIALKDGRSGSVAVTQSRDDIGSGLASPFMGPVDANIRVDLPVTVRIGTHEFTASVPANFVGHAKTTSAILRSL